MLDAIAAAAVVLAIAGFIWFMDSIGKGYSRMVGAAAADRDEERRAEALVPELAAAHAPDYQGRCRCGACRTRFTREPCSDYDGD